MSSYRDIKSNNRGHVISFFSCEKHYLFSFAVCLQSSAPALNISVNCHNFPESKVKVETGGQKLSYC